MNKVIQQHRIVDKITILMRLVMLLDKIKNKMALNLMNKVIQQESISVDNNQLRMLIIYMYKEDLSIDNLMSKVQLHSNITKEQIRLKQVKIT